MNLYRNFTTAACLVKEAKKGEMPSKRWKERLDREAKDLAVDTERFLKRTRNQQPGRQHSQHSHHSQHARRLPILPYWPFQALDVKRYDICEPPIPNRATFQPSRSLQEFLGRTTAEQDFELFWYPPSDGE